MRLHAPRASTEVTTMPNRMAGKAAVESERAHSEGTRDTSRGPGEAMPIARGFCETWFAGNRPRARRR